MSTREWSPRWSKGAIQLKKAIEDFLREREVHHDTHVYMQEEWKARGEKYGNDAIMTLTAEGPFYEAMNYPESKHDARIAEDFHKLLDDRGYWSEQGYAWTWHIYPKDKSEMGTNGADRPLLTLLDTIALTQPRLVLRQGDRYFCMTDIIDQARRDRANSEEARRAIDAPIYSSEVDAEGDLIIWRRTQKGRKVTFVEARSKVPTDP